MHVDPGSGLFLLLAVCPVLLLTTVGVESKPPAASDRVGDGMRLQSRWAWSAIVFGIIVRIWQYGLNRSVWVDEACLALNLIHRQYAELLRPLDYHQGAPLGFLFVERLLIEHWGPSEYTLRFFPLLAGIASLLMFYGVARRVVSPGALAVAMGLFAIAPPLIYYSSELKQYSCDVAVALLLYLIALSPPAANWSYLRIAGLGLIGAVVIWFSHPAVFVLASIATVFTVLLVAERNWKQLARFAAAYVLVLASMAVVYFVSLRNLVADNYLMKYWTDNFMPLPPKSVTDLKWFYDSFFEFFRSPVGFSFAGLSALAFIVGGHHLYARARDRTKFWLLLLPWVFALLASSLHRYPFGGRLALFLVPSAIMLIAEGADRVRLATQRDAWVVGYLLIGLLFIDPAVYLLHHFAKPHVLVTSPGIMLPEEIKPALSYVRAHERPTDMIYIFRDALPAYEYYSDIEHIHDNNLLPGIAEGSDSKDYVEDLGRLRGRQVWVIFSHVNGVQSDAPKYTRFYLDTMGKRLDVFSSPGAVAYLYDLSIPEPVNAPPAFSARPKQQSRN